MCKIYTFSKIVIVISALVACQGCSSKSPEAAAPAAGAEGGAEGVPSSYAPGPPQAGAAGAGNSDVGMLAGGAEGDSYTAVDGSMSGGPPSFGPPGGREGDSNIADGYGANYAAGMAASGAEGGGIAGYPGDGAFGAGQIAIKDPAPPEDADYMTKAKYAFAIGKESAAHQYLYAHILSNDAEAGSLLKQIRWQPSGIKPCATTRFAAAVILAAPPNLADLKPIGTSQMPGAGGGMSGGEMGMGSGPQAAAGQGGRTFQDMTGAFGEAIVTAFETRWSAGDFGTIFNQVTAIVPMNRAPGGGMGSMDGAYGSMGPGMDGTGSFGSGDGTTGPRQKTVAGKLITPGLLFLGTGSEGELVQKAVKEGIDALFLFEVEVKPSRAGVIQNDTRVRLVMIGGKSIGATQTLNNVKVERAQMQGGSKDVEKNVTVLFRKVDTPDKGVASLKLTDLPAIKPEHAKARIAKIIASKPKDILLALTEFKLYHSLGLVTDAEKSQAYQLALDGSDGEVLSTGAEEDRQTILNAKLPAYK